MQIALIVIPVAVLAISVLIGWRKNIYQAAITFGVTAVSVILSAVITELLSPQILEWAAPIVKGFIHDEAASDYLLNTQVGHEITQVAGSFIAPAIFFEVFILVLVVLSLLALIPLHFLSDKYKAKMAANKVAPALEQGEAAEGEQIETAEPTPAKSNKKVWLKVATVTLSVISGFIIFIFAMVPVTAYGDAIASVGNNFKHIAEGNSGVSHLVDDVEKFNSHPTVVVCKTVNSLVTDNFNSVTVQTKDGPIKDKATDIFNAGVRLIDRVSDMDPNNLQSNDLIEIAEIVDDDPYLTHFMNHVIHDAGANWKQGEKFLGVDPVIFVNEELSHELYELLSTSDVIKVMRMSGRLLGIVEVTSPEEVAPEEGNTSTEPKKELSVVVGELFDEVDGETVTIVDTLLKGEVMGELTGGDSSISNIDTSVFTSVIEVVNDVKQDEKLDEEQKQEELKKGAQALATLVELSQEDTKQNAEEILETFVSSDILMQTAVKVAEQSEGNDPLNVKDRMTDDALEKVEEKLLEYGYELNGPEHEALLKLLKK